MAYNMGGRRFRPVGSGKKRTAPQYGPVGTGCPFVEEAVARLYREQNEEHFWSLMNALNYALELQTKVLVPLDAAVDPQSGAAPLGTPAHPGGAGRGPAALAAPHPERAELSAAVHLGKER